MLHQVTAYEQNLAFLSGPDGLRLLTGLNRGIEKEGLRIDAHDRLAMTPHPHAMGSALTNPWLTTDFSEALLEFITPVSTSAETTLASLRDTHAYFYKHVAGEFIWAASMPCWLPEDDQIPVAQYGTSNRARMKTIYRIGLSHRYGRAMQTIAGIHYNFSMPEQYWQAAFEEAKSGGLTGQDRLRDFISMRYMDLIRNFRRNYWLVIYLMGASPCFNKSFVRARQHDMQALGSDDLYLPHATSLRMGDLGYQSIAQKSLFVCYNKLDTYIKTLGEAIHKPYPPYADIGIKVHGEYRQLNDSLLQIENEFYSAIRPKRIAPKGQTPLRALRERGVEYVEVRCLDVNPFHPVGIDAESLRFMDTFLIYCLIKDSPLCDQQEFRRISENQGRVVTRGRDPGLRVICGDNELPMRDCAHALLNDMQPVAAQLDRAHHSTAHTDSLATQQAKVAGDTPTPAARLLDTLSANRQSFLDFVKMQTHGFARDFRAHGISAAAENRLQADVEASIRKQRELEQEDNISFEDYLAAYYRQ
jgi:glutamate--cysteine ligase